MSETPSQNNGPEYIDGFVDDRQRSFDGRYGSVRKPQPVVPYEPHGSSSRTIDGRHHATPTYRPPPTLEEQIDFARMAADTEKISERIPHKEGSNTLRNGILFSAGVVYELGSGVFCYSHSPEGLMNRVAFYTYAQMLGIVAMDDSGREPYTGQTNEHSVTRGILLLPEMIEHTDFFALDDAIRAKWPFTKQEIRLEKLLDKQAGEPPREDSQFMAHPQDIRTLTDELLLSGQFEHLAEIGRELRARRPATP